MMYKAKAHSQYGRDVVGSERWQQQPQWQSHVSFQHLGLSEDTTCIKEYGDFQATMLNEPRNEKMSDSQ